MTFSARLVHFENRYWSIDQLLADLPVKNILELSYGFSSRSFGNIRQRGFYYIDTDLVHIIETKKEFVTALKKENFILRRGVEILPLNALDEDGFRNVVPDFQKERLQL